MNQQEHSPPDNDDKEEAFTIDVPPAYDGELPEAVEHLYEESYGPKGKGWRLLVGGAVIAITVTGVKHFRRKYGEDE